MEIAQAIKRLSELVIIIAEAKITNAKDFYKWAGGQTAFLNKLFDYHPIRGMPSVHSLMRPFFHPTLPLIGFNYTRAAHNTLHKFADGWTMPLRLCRGIVFDRAGDLVALPFSKFFNYGDNLEATNLPDEPWVATTKYDGHLGIIFKFGGEICLTTRGDFMSPTAQTARHYLAKYVRSNGWKKSFPEDLTLLVEIIHPETRVYVDYAGRKDFIVIGAYDRKTFHDYSYPEICKVAQWLRLPITETWQGDNFETLLEHMKDTSVQNEEGYVIRFASGLRVKVKYQAHIGKMVADKLSYIYLMRRVCQGNLQKMLETLPEEIYATALRMFGEIMLAFATPGTPQEKWRRLYLLETDERKTANFQKVCRDFVRMMTAKIA